jgi:hypothetical protein
MLQYTYYTKFNAAAYNYDGFGRNARDNNPLFSMCGSRTDHAGGFD